MEDLIKGTPINKKGYGIIPKLVMQDQELDVTAKAIYAYFCSYTGAGVECFPTRAKICYDLKISNDTLGKYLKQLVINGYIDIEQVKDNGKFSHNIYTVNSTVTKALNTDNTTNLPLPKISDTVISVYGNLDTNNNNTKINSNTKSNNSNIDKPKKSAKFTPPTVEDIKAYCKERNNNVDAKKFFDYYDTANWKDGKGNAVKNWKQKIITWERNESKTQAPTPEREYKEFWE